MVFTIMLVFLVDKNGNSSRMVAALRMSHSPDGVTVTPPSLYLYANFGGGVIAFNTIFFFLSDKDGTSSRIECEPLSRLGQTINELPVDCFTRMYDVLNRDM